MVTRFSKHHCLDSDPVEAVVVKVLETGAAIGFDFSSIEKEVAEAIAMREEEDDARFEAIMKTRNAKQQERETHSDLDKVNQVAEAHRVVWNLVCKLWGDRREVRNGGKLGSAI
ncbi:hypothetical protein Q3G72_004222 [Acer saccharum]|nr:hypothetical protein Q3G72_004222 [Acer saccharum]